MLFEDEQSPGKLESYGGYVFPVSCGLFFLKGRFGQWADAPHPLLPPPTTFSLSVLSPTIQIDFIYRL